MASEDVIELGSSDDEAEPAPKKRKPTPNAMVHIPGQIAGLSIKPVKHIKKPLPKGILPNPISIKPGKPPLPRIPNVQLIKKIPITLGPISQTHNNKSPLLLPKCSINPLNILNNSEIAIRKIAPKKPVRLETGLLNNLPPSITITKANISKRPNPFNPVKINVASISGLQKKTISIVKKNVGKNSVIKHGVVKAGATNREVLTVNLDDDEGTDLPVDSPQWYLRPEQALKSDTVKTVTENVEDKVSEIEKQNNKEPDGKTLVEITIEDSPIKPISRLGSEIGREIPITIEDSPVKHLKQKPESDYTNHKMNIEEAPQSKKRLDYPKDSEEKDIYEIELLPVESVPNVSEQCEPIDTICSEEDQSTSKEKEISRENDVIKEKKEVKEKLKTKEKGKSKVKEMSKELKKSKEYEKSKEKGMSIDNQSQDQIYQPVLKQKENKLGMEPEQPTVKDKTIISVEKSNEDPGVMNEQAGSDFHPVYQSFIDTCFQLENSDDMNKIVEKKIKTYYKQCRKEYVESEEFIEMVSSKISAMKAGPDKMYLYIKDVVDELNLQRKMAKSGILNKENIVTETNKSFYEEESEYDTKRQRQIRKLEKTIKKLHRAIQKLEEQEVDFDDEDDSVYLLTERYKERMVRVHAKFCQLTNTKMPSEPRIILEARPGRPLGPVKRLEKWINKKVPIGTPLPFPDFHDVLRCIREANEEDKLGWNDADIMEEARDLFQRCGKKLQRRRQENEWRLASSRISTDIDPAEKSDELKVKLNQNKSIAAKKESEVFNKFVDRQDQLHLEPEEIGDKEAEESPVESDEEEQTEASESLEDKQKRKERLKRLLLEKNKKISQGSIKSDENKNVSEKVFETQTDGKSNENPKVLPKQTDSEDVSKDGNDTKKVVIKHNDKVLNVSDSDLESDIDELHLLQKLHSENEACSSGFESSCSDSPIAISDTLESGSDAENAKKIPEDVISIEDSSYSESESNVERDVITMDVDEQNVVNLKGSNSNIKSPAREKIKIISNKNTPTREIRSGNEGENLTINSNDKLDTISVEENDDIEMIITKQNKNTEIKSGLKDDNEEEIEKVLLASSDEDENGKKEDDTISNTQQSKDVNEDVQNGNNYIESVAVSNDSSENSKDETMCITETTPQDKNWDSKIHHLNDNSSVESIETFVNQVDRNNDIDSIQDIINEVDTIGNVETSINLKDDTISVTETSIEFRSQSDENDKTKKDIIMEIAETDSNLRHDLISINDNSQEAMEWDTNNENNFQEPVIKNVETVNFNDGNRSITIQQSSEDSTKEQRHLNKISNNSEDQNEMCVDNVSYEVGIDEAKSVESVESVHIDDTKSVESVVSAQIEDTGSNESIVSTQIGDATSVKSVISANIEDATSVESVASAHIEGPKSIEKVLSTQLEDATSLKSVISENIEDLKSIESEPECVEETKSIESIRSLTDDKTETVEINENFECNVNNIVESAEV